MSISSRQTELFAGEQWKAIYAAFTQINFNASDPSSINAALQSYIQTSYPEDFNDWIESSEFVAIIDLLAWLAGTLAFKTDLAVRENFIDTAESRESILRLARFLSYNPNRCQSAVGIVKVTQVMTSDEILDSAGNNLSNQPIIWNDPDNPNWYEDYIAIMNAAFSSSNPFGLPLKTGTVGNTAAQSYCINGYATDSTLSFSANVAGTSMAFEACNGDFTDGGSFSERTPNPLTAMNIFYLNDSNGFGSQRTGFFLLFKQGQTFSQVFNIPTPVQNQLLDVTSSNINQNDVWVQTVDPTTGNVTVDWTIVPAILGSNITYNAVPTSTRTICSIVTRDNDAISVRFSDGNFGTAPSGVLKVTYRVSNGLSYSIRPQDIQNVSLPITYYNTAGVKQTLTLVLSLQETTSNAAPSETIESIRQRAPLVYGTQNRMVSGQDYNTYPLSTNLATKITALNRVYSGQSRYIDLHDPTGTYQDLSIFGDDGMFFKETQDNYQEIPLSLNYSPLQIINNVIQPFLSKQSVTDAVRDVVLQTVLQGGIPVPNGMTWTKSSAALYQTTGSFNVTNNFVAAGAMLKMQTGNGAPFWVGITSILGYANIAAPSGVAGPVTLSQTVPSGSVVLAILPAFSNILDSATISTILTKLSSNLSFSLWWDYSTNGGQWSIQTAQNTLSQPNVVGTSLLVMTVNYATSLWIVNVIGLQYVFESLTTVQWYDDGQRAIDQSTGDVSMDVVKIKKFNQDLNSNTGLALSKDYNLAIGSIYQYTDGTAEPRRTTVTFADLNNDGFPDDPDSFYKVISVANTDLQYLFWAISDDPYVTPFYTMWVYTTQALLNAATPANGTVAFVIAGTTSVTNNTFWVYNSGWSQVFDTYSYAIGRGSNVASNWVSGSGTVAPSSDLINFHWKHYAPSDHRIDPCQTNLHDIFVLTYSYDTAIRQWIANGSVVADLPQPPSELELRLSFSSLEQFRMFSDGIIWRPVSYKFLFGNGADAAYQCNFNVVRLPNTTVSDGEIKTQIINAINTYFGPGLWDFGDTFYWTGLAAYIHVQCAGLIGSIVPVPTSPNGEFGDLFEISSRCDEIFISTAQVSNIVMISQNTPTNLRMK